jgi:hypothetical protein
MVELPAPTMDTVVPEIVATAVFVLVYVKAPVLLVVGGGIMKEASPTAFIGIEKLEIVGVP